MKIVLFAVSLLLIRKCTVHCAVQFQYDSEQCLGKLVEYQCTVTGSPTLTWKVLQEDGTQFGLVTYTGSGIGSPVTIGGVFSVEQLSSSPSIVSKISFTVQFSINGYTIICQDHANKNLTIYISDPPPPPDNISSLLSNSDTLLINWTTPSYTSQCITSYTVNTTSTIISTTDTSVTIPLAGLSPGIYCVSVASVDTANRTGTYSEEKCLLLNVPSVPNVTRNINDDNVLTLFMNFVLADGTPSLSAVYISNNQSGLTTLPASQTTFNIPLEYGVVYNITVYGENILGMGLATSFTVSLPATGNSTMSVTPTMSNTAPPSKEQNNNTSNQCVLSCLMYIDPHVIFLLIFIVVAVSISIVLVFIFLIVAAICVYTLACAVKTKRSVPYTVSKRTMNTFIKDVRDALFSPCLDVCATAPPGGQMRPEEYTPEEEKEGAKAYNREKRKGKCRQM